MKPDLSIVIPTYQRTSWLLELLQSLAIQKGSFEVIVVDDGSPEGDHKEKSVKGGSWSFPLTYIRQDHAGPATARNRGLTLASSNIISFLDDDTAVEPNWTQHIALGYEDSKIAGVAGRTLSYRVETLAERFLDHEQHLVRHQFQSDGSLAYVCTANSSFLKSVLEQVNGFNCNLPLPAGDDMDLGFRIRKQGYFFRFNPEAVAKHRHRATLLAMWNLFLISGRGAYMCAQLNRELDLGHVTSPHLFEPGKVVRVLKDYAKKTSENLKNTQLRTSDSILFPFLEVLNHFFYQSGRIYERLRNAFR